MVASGMIGRGKVRLAALSCALVAVLLYIPALWNGFVAWDDGPFVAENPFIRSLDLSLLREAFLNFHPRIPNWNPLAFVSHAIDYALWGLHPAGHHLTSVLLHGLNTYLVVILVVRIFRTGSTRGNGIGDRGEGVSPQTLIAAATTGLLFAIHPVHVESVVWISERKDVLCAAFSLLTVISYLEYSLRMSRAKCASLRFRLIDRSYGMTALWFLLALLSKPMAVTLPAVLLILDWYPLRRPDDGYGWKGLIAEKAPLALLALGATALAILAERTYGGIVNANPFGLRMAVALESIPKYLGNLVYPFPLLPFYARPRSVDVLSVSFIGSLLAVVGITVLSVRSAMRGQRSWLALWAGFFVMLAPVLGFVQAGDQAMADRFLYLPSLALLGPAGYGVSVLITGPLTSRKRRALRAFAAGIGVLVTVALMALTIVQIAVWHDSISLWSRVIRFEPLTAKAYHQRGCEYLRRGKYPKAIEDFDETLRLERNNANAYDDRGIAYANLGLLQEAVREFTSGIHLDPLEPTFYRNRGAALRDLGRPAEAERDLRQADLLDELRRNAR